MKVCILPILSFLSLSLRGNEGALGSESLALLRDGPGENEILSRFPRVHLNPIDALACLRPLTLDGSQDYSARLGLQIRSGTTAQNSAPTARPAAKFNVPAT